jgi:uncharacterized membrane protein required for colicin V production
MRQILSQFNWFDIFALIIICRISYVALKTGFTTEIFKLLGIIFATYLALHYFSTLSEFVHGRLGLKIISLVLLDLLAFIFLVLIGVVIFVFLRLTFLRFLKMEAVPHLQRWGGFVLGFIRSFFVIGLISFLFVAFNLTYLERGVRLSYSGGQFFALAPRCYKWIWNNLTSKFMTQEKYNPSISQIVEGFKK